MNDCSTRSILSVPRSSHWLRIISWWSSHRGACPCLILMTAFTSGCGGDPPPAPAPIPQPVSESRPLGFAPRAKPKEEPKGLDLSGVDPDELFALADAPPSNFVTAGIAAPGEVTDRFRVTSRGLDETNFRARVRESGDEGESPRFSLPEGFQSIRSEPAIGGMPSRIVCQADGSRMALVPAGPSFAGWDAGPPHVGPQVQVNASAFYISVLEVTVNQFVQFRRQALKAGDGIEEPVNATARPEEPALGVAWGEARAYAQASGRDLPTEIQWEKAARGFNGLPRPWGDSRPLWRIPRKVEQIDPVGSHPDDKSPFGVMDMAGNAREWVLDFYGETALQELSLLDLAQRNDWSGPRRATNSGERTVKGGGTNWEVWARRGQRMTVREPKTGFRCVLNLKARR